MTCSQRTVMGWDIGGVNIKAALVQWEDDALKKVSPIVFPFEIWREPQSLASKLLDIAEKLGVQEKPDSAITMTAELSDAFRTKREGVRHVLDAAEQAFGRRRVRLFTLDGTFVGLREARRNPLACAAANWLASALFMASRHPDCTLLDIGSTTTDIIPIQNGKPVNRGRTDTQRLSFGELVYTGITRTNPNTFVNRVPVGGSYCRVAAEHFTSMADVYLILGRITSRQYSCPTADGRGKTVSEARERLARLVCLDSEQMSARDIHALAGYLQEKQLQQIVEALFQVLSAGAQDNEFSPLVVVGSGKFFAHEIGRRSGRKVIDPGGGWDVDTSAAFPAVAAAHLLYRQSSAGRK